MNRGQILASGPVDKVRHELGQAARTLTMVLVEGHVAAAEKFLQQATGVSEILRQGDRFSFRFAGDGIAQSMLLTAAVQQGLPVRALEEQKSSFEDILIQVATENRTFP